jgi:hypothetical protein
MPILTAVLNLGSAFRLVGLLSHVLDTPSVSTELAAMGRRCRRSRSRTRPRAPISSRPAFRERRLDYRRRLTASASARRCSISPRSAKPTIVVARRRGSTITTVGATVTSTLFVMKS